MIDFSRYKKSKMSPEQKSAKLSALDGMRSEMENLIGNDLKSKGMKKVTVASDDKQGLASGLDKAKEMLGSSEEESSEMGDLEGDEEEKQEEASEPSDIVQKEVEVAEHELLSHLTDPSQIDALIKMLEDKKQSLQKE